MLSCDIEDGFTASGSNGISSSGASVRMRKTKRPREDISAPENLESEVGWNKRVYVKSWGCAHNSSDSEYMSGLLSKAGYTLTHDEATADLLLLNSCTVKSMHSLSVSLATCLLQHHLNNSLHMLSIEEGRRKCLWLSLVAFRRLAFTI